MKPSKRYVLTLSADPTPNEQFAVSDESAEELYEAAPCGYLTTTTAGHIIKVNQTLLEWLGYEQAELTGGKRLVDLLTPGGRIFYETHFNLLLRIQKTVDEIALDFVCKGGRVLPALINARQKRNAEGVPVLNRFTIFNSSERRMYERELLAARDLLRITLASIGDGVVATDAEGRINFMNSIAENLTGWSNDAAHGKPIEEILILVGETDSEPIQNPIAEALQKGTVVELANHTVLVSRDGRRIPIDDSASPIRDENGKTVGGVLVFRDISERQKNAALERERHEQQREIARLESLGLMAGGIAHDFNNLLTAILGNASMLEEFVGARDVPLVKEILHAGERAATLTRQMLAYSGREWMNTVSVDLNAHIRDHFDVMRKAVPAAVQIELELGGDNLLIEGDASQIQQLIMNLLTNAAEAMANGRGLITIATASLNAVPSRFSEHMRCMVAAGPYAMIEVRDNGMGIAGTILRNIFDPFFTTKFTGRGLGLSQVLGIVRAHRGDIKVMSEAGTGSVFRVFLPASQRRSQNPVQTAKAPVRVAVGEQTILVVDDEEFIHKLVSEALRSQGMLVMAARNGLEALTILNTKPAISAVILDLKMPVMNGEEALPQIRALCPDLPVIISSAFGEAEILRRFASVRITGVLPKPYTVAALLAKVREALR
jgi:two-component system cell cycle sensor histidine kinase/response regulator CckA